MNDNNDQYMLNPNEAPEGYIAVLKTDARNNGKSDNYCNYCDWRKTCQNEDGKTDFDNPAHRCMSFPRINNRTGKEVVRKDKCSVVFKAIA